MTARQRQASDSAVAVLADSTPANGSANGDAPIFHWEVWFAGASPDQRAQALALAREQGLLYLQQLPAANDRSRAAASLSLVPLLGRLLAGRADGLPPLAEEPLTWSDSQLDPLQREAVRRALNTPDLFLLQGLPGTGKSRVVTEVITQAARRGWRVLLVAPGAPAVDVVLERLAGCPDVLPIRLLGPEERAENLPPALRVLTLAEQRRAFRERALAGARQARLQAEETCKRRQRDETIWPQLLPLSGRRLDIEDRLQALKQRQAEVLAAVEREAAGLPSDDGEPSERFAAELIDLNQRSFAAINEWQGAQKTLTEQQSAATKEQQEIAAGLAAVEPRCCAREQGRWWSPGYWTGPSALRDRETLHGRREQVEAMLCKLEQDATAQQAARQQIEAKAQAEREELVRAESERRRQALAADEAALRQQLQKVEQSWQSLCAAIQPAVLHPDGYQPADIDAAVQRWQQQRQRDEAGAQFARQWADYLDKAGAQLVPRLPALANLLAGPTTALAQGREWTEAAGTHFDLLIVEDAERLTESDLLRLAAHAPRLMLVSQVLSEPAATAPPAGKGPRSMHGLAPLAVCWPRLWHALGDDLGRLPYTWHREGDRLVCQLTVVRPEDARYLEREGLADAPEIELHILNLPRCKPVLARVSFPGHDTIPQATAFIYRELQELPIQPLGRTAWWQETADAFVLHLGPVPGAPTDGVDLGVGVRMELVGAGQAYAGRAAHLRFARSDGWDRTRAKGWLETNLQWRGRERAAYLQLTHRMYRPLAEVVGPLLFPEVCLASLLGSRAAADAMFEFIPVPNPRRPEWPREGAGLEQDLATGRHGDRLPADLRGELPRKGIVNYLEAQALVRRLEQWAQAPAELASNGKGAPAVLVLALYEAQAELLRRLTARSPILRARAFPLEIAVPGQVRHRECDVLVLSLTRSHAHRCVPLGEDAADLALALTRPRQRLLVFGDLGTLVKRTNWHGPLDHLDAPDAHVEALRVGRLLRHLQTLPGVSGAPTAAGR